MSVITSLLDKVQMSYDKTALSGVHNLLFYPQPLKQGDAPCCKWKWNEMHKAWRMGNVEYL